VQNQQVDSVDGTNLIKHKVRFFSVSTTFLSVLMRILRKLEQCESSSDVVRHWPVHRRTNIRHNAGLVVGCVQATVANITCSSACNAPMCISNLCIGFRKHTCNSHSLSCQPEI
jgi:hypothetical protein